jgi:uncharacterized peroxidase-related enzyme
MAHVTLTNDLPGIQGLLASFPASGKPLSQLAEVLLRGESPLSPAERELIAAHVSAVNDCQFCCQSHAAAASAMLGRPVASAKGAALETKNLDLSKKLQSLLDIAGAVAAGGKQVSAALVAQAREAGASEREIHDAVLVAAAFCRYNRYVDGLATWCPEAREDYVAVGEMLAQRGYLR